MKPLLSIITVCFNAEATIGDCIQSVEQGKTPEVEYLMIDGASTDGTLDIVRQHPEVIDALISEADDGIFDAMNKGLLMANGDFVAFLNADDTYLPSTIPLILETIRRAGNVVDVFYGDWIGIDATGASRHRQSDHLLRWRYSLCHQAVVARRTIFPVPRGFDLQYRFCADFDLIMRWRSEGVAFKRLAQPLVHFSETGSSAKFMRRSAWESIVIALHRGHSPWAAVFSMRVMLYLARRTSLAWLHRMAKQTYISRLFR